MRRGLQVISKLNRLAYASTIQEATHGTIKITDDEVLFESNGVIRILEIIFDGTASISNQLPNGYHINIKEHKLRIVNILGRKLNDKGLLFNFGGTMVITKCSATTFQKDKFSVDISDTNKKQLIGFSDTKVEDDSLLLLEQADTFIGDIKYIGIDDDTIRGLYRKTPFPNGYSGYYNYSPKQKAYTTKNAEPILNPNISLSPNVINKKLKKINSAISTQKSQALYNMSKRAFQKEKDVSVYKKRVDIKTPTRKRKIKRGK